MGTKSQLVLPRVVYVIGPWANQIPWYEGPRKPWWHIIGRRWLWSIWRVGEPGMAHTHTYKIFGASARSANKKRERTSGVLASTSLMLMILLSFTLQAPSRAYDGVWVHGEQDSRTWYFAACYSAAHLTTHNPLTCVLTSQSNVARLGPSLIPSLSPAPAVSGPLKLLHCEA